MPNAYTSNLKLALPALNDAGWDGTLNGNFAAIDSQAMLADFAVTTAESPSASLAVAIAPGGFVQSSGTYATSPGTTSIGMPASSTTYLWITDSGTPTTGPAWPSSAHVRLAVVTTGASTVTGILDARTSLRTAGVVPTLPIRTVTAATTTTATDGVIRADATSGALTVTLGTVPGVVIRVKKIDGSSNAVTITPASGTIDGASSITLAAQYQAKALIYDPGSNTWGVY